MEKINRFNVVHRYRKRSLLIAINSVAALSIFFFGYDQGMMAGVNTAVEYYTRMGFAHPDDKGEPVITNSLLQGGIVSPPGVSLHEILEQLPKSYRCPCTTLVLLSVLSLVAGLETNMAASSPSLSEPPGPSSELPCRLLP